MGKYEIMYILTPTLDDEARKAEIEKLHSILTAQKAQVKNVREWGVREFANPIKKQTKGYYVIVKVSAEPEGLKEFDRLARLDNNVIRFLITVDQD
ncbi:MAG: 30S ribosomal protein S6 [Erysipelotrichaceae bacterium]|jgi:small subunit ribosomal protein S6|nr:30S ribosomal protein S6 [Erysipelotrichaceae bacterium]